MTVADITGGMALEEVRSQELGRDNQYQYHRCMHCLVQ